MKLANRQEIAKRRIVVGSGGHLQNHPVRLEPTYLSDTHRSIGGRGTSPSLIRSLLKKFIPERTRPQKPTPDINVPLDWRFLRIRPSEDDRYTQELSQQLLTSLDANRPMAFEVVRVSGKVLLQLAVSSKDANIAVSQLESHFPDCEAFLAQDGLNDAEIQLRYARGYRLRRSHLFPLKTDFKTETYASLLGIMGALDQSETAIFQVLFARTRRDWEKAILQAARDPSDLSKSTFVNLPQLPKRAEAKVSKPPIFAVSIRIAASSLDIVLRLQDSFLSQFQSDENGLVAINEPYPMNGIQQRTNYASGMLLNSSETAALVHIPDPDSVPDSLEAALPGAPVPTMAKRDTLVPLGINRYRGITNPAGISGEQLSRHMAIFGGSGNGKTNLMQVAFEPHLEQGGGLAALDFKGDFAQGLLDRIPAHRIKDVVWFDPTDREHPPALNVLEASSGLSAESLTAELMVGLKRLFHGNSEFGPRMEWILRGAVRTLLCSEGEKTLYDIPRFLENAAYRDSVLASVQDRELREFWQRRNLSQTVIDPVLNRLSSFLDRPTIRNIVAQPNRIDFRQIMSRRQIFIANLEKGQLQDAAFVLGSFILSRLQLAALARPPKDRSLFPIICDEFHNLAGDGMDTESIETFLSESRSYMAPLVVSTQYVGRLNRDVVTALFGNVGTQVCMHLGQIDAQLMQRELGDFTAEDLLDLGIGEAVVRMGSARDSFNIKIPLAEPRDSHRAEIVARSREQYCSPKGQIETHLLQTREASSSLSTSAKPELSPQERQFLAYISEHPEDTITAAQQSLGFSGRAAQRTRENLVEKKYLQVVETRLGKGGNLAKFAVPSKAGLDLLGKKLPGRGGPVHRHFQQAIANYAVSLGFQAEIEKKLTAGGYVDVHLERDGDVIAVEVSVVPEVLREFRNIEKCLKNGYQRIFALFLDQPALQEAQREANQRWPDEIRQKVSLASVYDLEILIGTVSASGIGNSGNTGNSK